MSIDIGQSATIRTDKGPVTVYSAEYVAELQAQVSRLRGALSDVSAALHDERCCAPCTTVDGVIACAPAVLTETPAQSVAHIEAAAIRRTVALFGDHYYGTGGGDAVAALSSYADRIEQGAES
jgi:hypothetical protein